LHELDEKVKEIAQAYDKGKDRRRHPEYRQIEGKLYRMRKRIDKTRSEGDIMRTNELMKEYRKIRLTYGNAQAKDQMDPEFKRLNYNRYADDVRRS
jgi:hypothetical protein